MEKRLLIYLRPLRRHWRLTHEEVARLLGYAAASSSCRTEGGSRDPSLVDAFALQVIFGRTPIELFPALFEDAEEAVLRRAKELYEQLEDSTSAVDQKKLELLRELLARAIDRHSKKT